MIKNFFFFLIFHFLPYESLIRRLRRHIEIHGYHFFPEISGRASLYKLASTLKGNSDKGLALAPDYICNVVYVALEAAGYEVRTYPTDHLFEPLMLELENELTDERVGILLTASIFGSTAFLEQLKSEKFRELVIQRNIHVIVDLCQDINLVRYLPDDYGVNVSSILSFNDKSFPGLMGGGILTKIDLPVTTERLSISQTTKLYGMILGKIKLNTIEAIKSKRRRICKDVEKSLQSQQVITAYDYSYCRVFPHKIEVIMIAKIQIIMALIGFTNLTTINKKKKMFAEHVQNILKTKHYETTPYLVLTKPNSSWEIVYRKRKPPYACHKNPEQSVRREIIIIHNKGFSDDKS